MPTPRRSWFRFSLFAVAVFATLCCGYLGYYRGHQQGFTKGVIDGKAHHFVTLPYEVGDLVTTTENLTPLMSLDELAKTIQMAVAPQTWATVGGGESKIVQQPETKTLLISQNQLVHEEISHLLVELRAMAE